MISSFLWKPTWCHCQRHCYVFFASYWQFPSAGRRLPCILSLTTLAGGSTSMQELLRSRSTKSSNWARVHRTPHLAAKNDTQVPGEAYWISNVDYSIISTYADLDPLLVPRPLHHPCNTFQYWCRRMASHSSIFNTEFDISYSTSGLGYTIIRKIDFCPTSNSIIPGRSYLLTYQNRKQDLATHYQSKFVET